MNAAATTLRNEANVTLTELGWKWIHWGLGLFIAGFVTGFIPILHYMHGASGDIGPAFLKNMTLPWGCPGVLAELTLKTGGLGMVAIGLSYVAAAIQGASPSIAKREPIAQTLCAYGLIAELVTAAVGYAICNRIWPNFYFDAIQAGKNTWLAAQGVSILVFVVGACYGVAGVRRAASQLR